MSLTRGYYLPLLVASAVVACGGESQVDQYNPSEGARSGFGGSHGGQGGRVGRSPDGGTDASAGASVGPQGGTSGVRNGAAGSPPGSGSAGTTTGGGSAGTTSGSGSAGTTSGGGMSGIGAVGGAGAGTGGRILEADAGSPLIDPHATERKELAEDYCAACPTGPDCAATLNVQWFNDLPLQCWDELVASERCSKANNCIPPISGGRVDGGLCFAERSALDACIRTGDIYRGSITGSVTTCSWRRVISGSACEVSCAEDPLRFYDTQCSGPPDGPFDCWCALNGRKLVDSMISNGPRFFTDTCQAAGQLMADGHCHQFINCCYSFHGTPEVPLPEQTLCECTSDPTVGGQFKSCEELAASHTDGQVVELCPGYQPYNVVP